MSIIAARFSSGRLVQLIIASIILALILVLTVAAQPAQAAGTVTNCTWAGAGGLQAALAGGGAVTFACDGTIIVPEIVIAQDTVLDGTIHDVTLSGNDANRVLRVAGGSDLTVRNLTIANGQPQGVGSGADNTGGGINAIAGGDLTIENSVFENNKSLSVGSDIFAARSGGAILYQNSNGVLTIRDSTFRNNQTTGSGGALYIDGRPATKPSVTITGSTFSNNQAPNVVPNSGGAIYVDGSAAITITNSTLSGNSAYRGGGLALDQSLSNQNLTVRLTHVTLAGNTATQGANFYSSKTSSSIQTVDLANTIVGGGCSLNSGATLNSLGYNLSSDSSCGFAAATDLQNTDPQLAALADNGGPTQTRALNPGSPAINKIPLVNGSCNDSGVTTDQRGYARPEPSGTLCDIGAYEADAQPPADAGLTIVKETIGGGGVFTFTSTSLTPSRFTLTAGQSGAFTGTRNIIGSTRYFNCALQTDGNVLCWGLAPTPPAGPFVELVVGYEHACGLRPDGSVDCWGDNDFGQATDQPGPYTQVATGENYTCGLTPAGAAECWGRNDAGQAQPQPGPYVALDGGYEQTCGLTPTGALECWGDSPFTNAGPFTQMSVGGRGGCAVRPNGDLFCWGSSDLQPGARVGPWIEVSVGQETAVGLRANGTLDIWGDSTYLNSPALTPPAGSFVRLGQSQWRTYCALDANGAADCWGFGTHATDQPGPFGSPSHKTFSNLAAGTYDVSEQVPAGWSLSDLSCDGGNPQVNGATVSVTLAQSEQVTCTYEDTPTSTIVITKQTAPADNAGTQQFGFTDNIASPNNFTLVHGQGRVFLDVPTGTYTVTETSAASGYYLADLTCTETGGQSQANSSGNVATGEATINLEPGETVRCTYTNALADVIIVEKVTDPSDPSGNFEFDFSVTGGVTPISPFTLKDGEQETNIVGAGTYTITEGVSLFHDLTAIECAIVDSIGNETPVSGNLTTRSATLTLGTGEIGFCRFTNTAQASLTVAKEAFPPDGTNFQFEVRDTFSSLINAFGLQDTDVITNPEHLVGGGLLEPGFYTINELVGNVPDWANVNIACELDDGTPKSFANGSYGEIVVDLAPGEDVTCTFTNVLMGKINITKQATPADGTVFSFGGELGTFTLTHGLLAEYIVPFGAYDVDEAPPLGWQLDDVQCVVDSGSTSTFDYTTVPDGVRIDLGPGEEVTCTFNNSEIPRGTINVVKDATPADNTPFRFANTIDNVPFTLSDPLTTTQTYSEVLPGLYRVIELQDNTAWDLTGIDCVETGDQNSAVSVPFRAAEIQVDPGETVSCTFSNLEVLTGTVNILKVADPADGTPFSFASDIPGNTSFTLADDGVSDAYVKTITGVLAGSYVVTETVANGWALADVACYDDNFDSVGDVANGRAQIELQGNEEVTCVFANQAVPSIVMTKTVGTDAGVCATTDNITVVAGTDVYYCYTVTNTGKVALPLHDLVDDQLGTLLDDFSFDLAPGASVNTVAAGAVISATANANVTNTAVWTAFVDADVTASFTDTATVTVTPRPGRIIVDKVTDPANSTQSFSFSLAGPSVNLSFDLTAADAPYDSGDLAAGSYSVTETPVDGWTQVSASCDNGSAPNAIDLGPGETVTCTFTNQQNAPDLGTVRIRKVVQSGPTGPFMFSHDIGSGGSFDLNAGEEEVVTSVPPGAYQVDESLPQGSVLQNIVCTDSDPNGVPSQGVVEQRRALINLDPAETVECTFTNGQDPTGLDDDDLPKLKIYLPKVSN